MIIGGVGGDEPVRVVARAEPVEWRRALAWQEAVHAAVVAGRAPETVFLLVHPPTVTLGRRGRDAALLRPAEELREAGVAVHVAGRGGDVTYHGPGQWVIYPIFRVGRAGPDARGHLWNLEEIAIRTCADFGVEAWRRPGLSGAWTRAGKIAAIGFQLRRWVSLHGTSFNVDPRPNGFDWIVPCGLKGEPVAALADLLGPAVPSMAAVGERLLANLATVFGRRIVVHWTEGDPPEELAGLLADAGPNSSAAADT